MIRELLTYFSERPSLKEAKTFGHLVESISLLSREKRCKKTWATHRAASKNFITGEIKNARHHESLLILGSGPLHEIPIETLARSFKRVVLVDIVHLKSTKKSVAHLKNLEFLEYDISEVESLLRSNEELFKKMPERFREDDWGLVISANIMSQLPLHLERYIEKKLKHKFSHLAVKDFLQNVTKNHLHYLQSFKAHVLLITDVQTHYYDKKDNIIQTDENYPFLSLPKPVEEWSWNLAPIPEFQKDIGIKMRVCGFVIKNTNSH